MAILNANHISLDSLRVSSEFPLGSSLGSPLGFFRFLLLLFITFNRFQFEKKKELQLRVNFALAKPDKYVRWQHLDSRVGGAEGGGAGAGEAQTNKPHKMRKYLPTDKRVRQGVTPLVDPFQLLPTLRFNCFPISPKILLTSSLLPFLSLYLQKTATAKPTKYHYYPHNQHIYLLPECAIQQVCNAVYVRLNYTQPLCACPSR